MVWPPTAAFTPRMRAVKDGYMAGSTPTTETALERVLAAVATPAISPPPPIGTGRTSRSGTFSNISSAMVAWPTITSGSLKGWTKVRPRSAHSRWATSPASS